MARLSVLESLMEAEPRFKTSQNDVCLIHMGGPKISTAQSMSKHPNVMVEFGAREAELGRQPSQRDLVLKYQDRVMFGTDNGVSEEMSK
jgi:predicted TIM-barrel fold metal-dependent hydrolase